MIEGPLYGLLGASLDLFDIDGNLLLNCFAISLLGIIIRCISTFISLCNSEFSKRERVFITVSYIAKSDTLAVFGGYIYGISELTNLEDEYIEMGKIIVAVSVLTILMSCPLGSILMGFTGRLLLIKKNDILP